MSDDDPAEVPPETGMARSPAQRGHSTTYYATPEGLWQDTGTGVPVQLMSGVVEIAEILTRDHGDGSQDVRYVVRVRRGDDVVSVEATPSALVRLNRFLARVGVPRVVVHPYRERSAVRAIHALSAEAPRRTIYAHMGWREVDGRWLYLHGTGAIGPDGPVEGIDVAPGVPGYGLPAPLAGGELVDAMAVVSQAVADAGPTLSALLGAAWRAALPVAAPFSLHLPDRQDDESTVAMAEVALACFGPSATAFWNVTPAAWEWVAWTSANTLVALDTVALRPRPRPVRAPRGLVVAVGQCPASAPALVIADPGPVDRAALKRVHDAARSGVLAGAMAAFVAWLARQVAQSGMGALRSSIEAREADFTRQLGDEAPKASLATGWAWWLAFCEDQAGLAPSEADGILQSAIRALGAVG